MTNDRFMGWLESSGYSYKPSERAWIHNDGRELVAREFSANEIVDGTLLLRDEPNKVEGLARAVEGRKMQDFTKDFDDSFQVAKAGFDNLNTLSGLSTFSGDTLIKNAENNLPASKKKYFGLIEDDIRELGQEVDVEAIKDFAKKFRTAKTEADLITIGQEAKRDFKGLGFEKVVAVTGLEGPDIFVVKKKANSAYAKAKDRIEKNKRRQEEAQTLTPEFILSSSNKTVNSFASAWGFDKDNPDDIRKVETLLVGKKLRLDVTPSGQRRISKAKGIFET